MNTQTFIQNEFTITEWKTSSTTTARTAERFYPVGTMDISLAELAMRQVNRFLEDGDKEQMLKRFEENRGEAFERFYGSMETSI